MKLKLPSFSSLESIKTGDMPGDKIEISDKHIKNVQTITNHIGSFIQNDKLVISIYGGSGVGKSETASLLGYVLEHNGYSNYIISGDNYPRRIPPKNDQERMRIYREFALKGLVKSGLYKTAQSELINSLIPYERDLDPRMIENYPFLKPYQESGYEGLKKYLGTKTETDFDEINDIIARFKQGEDRLYLKRMGREEQSLWYDLVNFKNIQVLILEWTHGNNPLLAGVDVPILLNSTPEETLAHRLKRNRDGKVDSPFVKTVLKIEQDMIKQYAHTAKLIITKQGDLITYDNYLKVMA